jgi:hypothetical protein
MRRDRFKGSERILAVPGGPFRAHSGGGISQGEPWAMLSWHLRAVRPALTTYSPWAMLYGPSDLASRDGLPASK